MADAADSTPASGGQFALTVADLNTTMDHEPRVSHRKLARALGYTDDRKLLPLAERHRSALERFGAISATVAENTDPRGRGRPGKIEWYTKRQALYLCTKSETPRATEATIAMVEVFDAHLAGRPAAPRAEIPAPIAFLLGPERLVSSLHVAQALRRRHTGILRLLDVLAAERPELLGQHVRFATYLHENGRPYRCFHMDRIGFDALMARIPFTDGVSEAVRDATLRAWPADALPPPAEPALEARLDQDGFALMRLAGETLVVDMARYEVETDERAVRLHWDGAITVGTVDRHRLGSDGRPRLAMATPPQPVGKHSRAFDLVRVLGAVVTAQPIMAPGRDAEAPSVGRRPSAGRRETKAVRRFDAAPGLPRSPDLATAAPLGSA